MSERIKLQNAGDELVMHVRTVTFEKIESTDYAKFDDGSRELLVPCKSAERQIERVGVASVAAIAGKIVRFSRSKELNKYGKPYWNLDPANPADLKAPAPPKRLTHEEAVGDLPGHPSSEYNEDMARMAPAAPPSEGEPDPRQIARRANLAAYKALWAHMAQFQREVCTAEGTEGEGPQERIPYDAASITAATATVWIQWDKMGLAPR